MSPYECDPPEWEQKPCAGCMWFDPCPCGCGMGVCRGETAWLWTPDDGGCEGWTGRETDCRVAEYSTGKGR